MQLRLLWIIKAEHDFIAYLTHDYIVEHLDVNIGLYLKFKSAFIYDNNLMRG
jgi:hypothetical protein